MNLVGGLYARIDEMTMSNTRQVEVLSKRIDGLAKKMEDLTGRFGHLTEEAIRRKLAESKGVNVKWSVKDIADVDGDPTPKENFEWRRESIPYLLRIGSLESGEMW
jgi:hypothetical protein